MKQLLKRGLLWALYANIGSLLAGFFLKNEIGIPSQVENFLIYFTLTCILEWGVLLILTKGKEWKMVSLTALLMNLASYGIIAILIWGFDAM